MNSTICTLFEGSYHFGVAALANSLHRAGFRGELFAGYRGATPPWARSASPVSIDGWPGAARQIVDDGMAIVFAPLTTTQHLANYKPQFMLDLLDAPVGGADALFYFDPDICVIRDWRYFEQWVQCGVALCEDVNSPLAEHHPRRVGWRRYYEPRGLPLRFRGTEYINSGFVGVLAADRSFLELWLRAMTLMEAEIGSLSIALAANSAYRSTGFADCFDRTDQDGLNVAAQATERALSIIGQEAMGLKPGAPLLPHALGHHKPWQRNYLLSSLRGIRPRLADKAFWENVHHPIRPYSRWTELMKSLDLRAAAAIGRVFARG